MPNSTPLRPRTKPVNATHRNATSSSNAPGHPWADTRKNLAIRHREAPSGQDTPAPKATVTAVPHRERETVLAGSPSSTGRDRRTGCFAPPGLADLAQEAPAPGAAVLSVRLVSNICWLDFPLQIFPEISQTLCGDLEGRGAMTGRGTPEVDPSRSPPTPSPTGSAIPGRRAPGAP